VKDAAAALRQIAAGFVALADALEKERSGPTADVPALLEERAIAARFGIEPRALAAARKGGELVGHRVGRRVLLAVADVEAWARSRSDAWGSGEQRKVRPPPAPRRSAPADAVDEALDASDAEFDAMSARAGFAIVRREENPGFGSFGQATAVYYCRVAHDVDPAIDPERLAIKLIARGVDPAVARVEAAVTAEERQRRDEEKHAQYVARRDFLMERRQAKLRAASTVHILRSYRSICGRPAGSVKTWPENLGYVTHTETDLMPFATCAICRAKLGLPSA
jgi:hypothetical protein